MQDANHFLAWLLTVLGGLSLLAGVLSIRFSAALRSLLAAFPRSKWPGWVLTALCVAWVSWVIYHAALGRFEGVKPVIPVLAVAVFAAIVGFLDELLSPRALGGALLLLADPVLDGVRWVDSAWRFVPAVIAYAWVIIGCAWMLHPWLFRKMAEWFWKSDRTLRMAAWSKILAGSVLLLAGLWQLR